MRSSPLAALAIVLLGPACFTGTNTAAVQGDQGTNCANCKHGTGGSSGGRGGSSGGTGKGSSGTTGAGQSGGTSGGSNGGSSGTSEASAGSSSGGSGGGPDAGCAENSGSPDAGSAAGLACSEPPVPPYDGGCPSGSAVRSLLVDIATCSAVSATISAIDSNGVPVSGDSTLSQPCNGSFSLCTPSGGPFSLQIQAAGYPITYVAEMTSVSSGSFPFLSLVPSSMLTALGALLPVQVDPSKDTLVVGLSSQSGHCKGAPAAGWVYSLTLPDGGAFPDGGYYLSYEDTSFFPDHSLTATSELGAGIFFNVDPTISGYVLITATNPNPGTCDPRNASLGFTGRVLVTDSALSYDAFLLP